MIKKILLIASIIIFAISCSNNSNNTEQAITNPAEISNFLKQYDGRYYHEHEFTNGSYTHVAFRVENGNMYIGEDKEPVNDLSLLNNSLEINVNGNTQLSNTYNQIYSILEVNFFDDHIKFSGKNIFDKEDFNIPDEDYIVIKQFKDLGIYAGNYYIPTLDDKGNVKTKNYTILIDKSGNIYGYKGMTNVGMTFTLEGNVLKSEHNNNGDKIIMSYKLEQDRIVYQINFIYGSEYSYELMKSDLFTPYMGTYSAGNITLQVNENNASINTATTGNYYSSIINGNNLVISEILFENDTDPIEIKEHKITFSDDKTKATYTKPDGTTVELIKK
ncbi:hypothetical protein [Brachyspira intermedia]|uniref:hypothetical protein n=1 Tax=Brachyspira intermedia TaxID=84377 RepID=UPI002637C228|nr:hypothetical protein [uncultured Brachyspira sp.]